MKLKILIVFLLLPTWILAQDDFGQVGGGNTHTGNVTITGNLDVDGTATFADVVIETSLTLSGVVSGAFTVTQATLDSFFVYDATTGDLLRLENNNSAVISVANAAVPVLTGTATGWGIGTASPRGVIDVNPASGGTASSDTIAIFGNDVDATLDSTIYIDSAGRLYSSLTSFIVEDASGDDVVVIDQSASGNAGRILLYDDASLDVTISAGDAVEFNRNTSDQDFIIDGDNVANLFFLDAGNDRIGIGTALPATDLQIGATSADDVQPAFSMVGDADSDAGGDTDDTFQLTLTANATPTLATWNFTSTQSAGYTFDKSVTIGSGAAGIDYTLTFNGETTDEVITHFEDERQLWFTGGLTNDQIYISHSANVGGLNASRDLTIMSGLSSDITLDPSGAGSETVFVGDLADGDIFHVRNSTVDTALVVSGTGTVFMEGLGSGTGTQLSRVANTDQIVEETSLAFFKNNIRPATFDPYKVLELDLKEWEWNEYSANNGQSDWGFITDEVDLVSKDLRSGNTWSPKKVVAALTQVVKEQQKRIKELEQRLP